MKVFCGECILERLGEIFLLNLALGKVCIISLIDGQKKESGKKFLSGRHDPDNEWNSIDSTINRAHQHASGARKGEDIAIGRSKGGLTTKVHMLADAHGNPLEFTITEGQAHDMTEASILVDMTEAEFLLGDKGYDSDPLREQALAKGTIPVIPRKKNSVKANPCFDKELYKARHVVENLFAKMKNFRAFSTRYDKLKRNYASTVAIVCSVIWFKLLIN